MKGRTTNTQRTNACGYASGGAVPAGTSSAKASGEVKARRDGGACRVDGGPAKPSLARVGRKVKRADGGGVDRIPDTELERRVREEPLSVGNPNALAAGAGAGTALHMAARSRLPGAVRAVIGGLGTGTAAHFGKRMVDDVGRVFEASDAEAELRRRARDGAAEGHGLKARAKGGPVKGNWIAGATQNKGALHRALKVPMGDKIPAAKINKAAHSSNPKLAKQANLAKTLKGFNKG